MSILLAEELLLLITDDVSGRLSVPQLRPMPGSVARTSSSWP